MARTWFPLVAIALAALAPGRAPLAEQPSRLRPRDPLVIPSDYPPADSRFWDLEKTGLQAKLARQALATAPDALDTFRVLVRAKRLDDALHTLTRIVERHPIDLESSTNDIYELFGDVSNDRLHDRSDAMRRLAELTRVPPKAASREDAARIARVFLTIGQQFASGGRDESMRRLRDFIAEWSGTEAALIAEVDVMAASPASPQNLEALDTFARAHPRTTAAAKALYTRAFNLGVNASAYRVGGAGEDPLARFLQIRDIASELERGGYPDCEWVARAPDLMDHVFVYQPSYSEASVRTLIEAYEHEARTRFGLDETWPTRGGTGYIVTSRLAELYQIRDHDDGVAGVDRLLSGWARDPAIGADAQLLLALFYVDQERSARSERDHARFAARARETMRTLYETANGVHQRKALAMLAVFEQDKGEYAAAVRYLVEYLQRYPDTRWSWVAALRLGKAYEGLEDWPAASNAYADADKRYGGRAPVSVLSLLYAGQADEALGRAAAAVAKYRRAIEKWDDDYGAAFWSPFDRLPRRNDPFPDRGDIWISRADQSDRIADLTRLLRAPGGEVLAHAQWQLAQRQFDVAIATASRIAAANPQSSAAREARTLVHRATVDRALATGDLSGLEALEREPYDFWISAARIVRAAKLWRDGAKPQAETLMKAALSEWHERQFADATTPDPVSRAIEQDVVELRNLSFRPRGDGLFSGSQWELKSLSPPDTPFFVVSPELRIKLSTGEIVRVNVRRPIPDFANVLFLDDQQLVFFDRLLAKIGGTERRVPRSIMEVPNQPAGGASEVLALLQTFFPARPGHWGGWMLLTFPIVSMMEFVDAARTKAAVPVTIGYEGATLIFEKRNGAWTFKEMTNRWIT